MNETTNSPGLVAPALPGVGELLRGAIAFYRSHFNLILWISVAPMLLGLIQILTRRGNIVMEIVFGILVFAVVFLAQLALFQVVIRQSTNAVDAYKSGVRMLIPFVWINILVTLVAVGGLVLLVVPGIILSILLSFSAYILFSEDRKGYAALIQSWHYVRAHWWPVFWRFVAFGVIIFIVGALLLLLTGGPEALVMQKGGVIVYNSGAQPEVPLLPQLVSLVFNSLLIVPLSVIYYWGIFNSLRQIRGSEVAPEDVQKYQKYLKIFTALGIVGILGLLGVGIYFFKLGTILSQF